MIRQMDLLAPGEPLVESSISKRLCNIEEDFSSSSSENSSSQYFLRSQKKPICSGGLGKEVISSLDRGG